MNEGISLTDAIISVFITLIIVSIVTSLVKINSEFEIRYESNIQNIETEVYTIYQGNKGIYVH